MNTPTFKLRESTAFFNFIRIVLEMLDPADAIVSARLLRKGNGVGDKYRDMQIFTIDASGAAALQAFVDRKTFPDAYSVQILSRSGAHETDCTTLVEMERTEHTRSSLDDFFALLRDWRREHPGATPKVLDIGGRARSGYLLAAHLPGCQVTVLDIRADPGVDVVADIHEMSGAVGADAFDFIICVSVFEHLVMPWKAAIEINKVLKTGGMAMIQTHQTVGLHDRPWDYFRFSDDAWTGLFNGATGFEIVKTMMNNFVRITPMRYCNVEVEGEKMGGFYESSVIVRKSGDTDLAWPVAREAIVGTIYPH